ncbi:unnamed protein product [Durusdinium trenchii]|uniref:Uncharacterized protein n=1 Tax=Durusdinium trenchii TaxID=1381693 RepID=A0ABP0LZS0_9DINO
MDRGKEYVDQLVWRLMKVSAPKVMVLLVLTTIWSMDSLPEELNLQALERLQWCEFFAGQAEATKAFKAGHDMSRLKRRAWSTSELAVGLGHILTDGRLEEVDDVAPFQELEGILADLEAKQSTDAAMQELMAEPAQAAPPGEH